MRSLLGLLAAGALIFGSLLFSRFCPGFRLPLVVAPCPEPRPAEPLASEQPASRGLRTPQDASATVSHVRLGSQAEPSPVSLRSSRAGLGRTPFPGEETLPDPDGIGPCPKRMLTWHPDSAVVRRGLDADGWPTWWHADGTLTKRTLIPVTKGGQTVDLEDVLTLERAPTRALARPGTAPGASAPGPGGEPPSARPVQGDGE